MKLLLLTSILIATICRPTFAADWNDIATIVNRGWGATIHSPEKENTSIDVLHLRISGLSQTDLEFVGKCKKLESITILGTSLSPSQLLPVLRELPNLRSIVVSMNGALGPVIAEPNWESVGKSVEGARLKRIAVVGNASEVDELIRNFEFDRIEIVFNGRGGIATAKVFEELQSRTDLVQLDIVCCTLGGTPLQIPPSLMAKMAGLKRAGFTNCIIPSVSLPAQLGELKLVDSVIEGGIAELLRSRLRSIELIQMDKSQIVASGFSKVDPDSYGGSIFLEGLDVGAMDCFRNWSCKKHLVFGARHALSLNIDDPACLSLKRSKVSLTEQELLDFADQPNVMTIEVDSRVLGSVSGATTAKLNEQRMLTKFGYAGAIEPTKASFAPIEKSSLTVSLNTLLSGVFNDSIRNSENLNLEVFFPKHNISIPQRELARANHFGVGFAKDSRVLAEFLQLNVGEFTRTINLYSCEIDQAILEILVKECKNLEKISLALCYSEENLSFGSLDSLEHLTSIDLKATDFLPTKSLLARPGLLVRFGD